MLIAFSKLTTFDEVCSGYSKEKYPSLSVDVIKNSLKDGMRMRYLPQAFGEEPNLTIMKINLRLKLGFNRHENSKITSRLTLNLVTKDDKNIIEMMNKYFSCIDQLLKQNSKYADNLFATCDLRLKPLFEEALKSNVILSSKLLWHRRKLVKEYMSIKDNFTQKLLKSKHLFKNSQNDPSIDQYFVRLECVSFDPTLFGIVHENYVFKNRKFNLIDRLKGRTDFGERLFLYRRLARIISKLHSLNHYHGKLRTEDFVQLSAKSEDYDSPLEHGIKLIVFPTNRDDFLDVFETVPQNVYIDPELTQKVNVNELENDLIIKFAEEKSVFANKLSRDDYVKKLFRYRSGLTDKDFVMADVYSLGVIYLSMEYIAVSGQNPQFDSIVELLKGFDEMVTKNARDIYGNEFSQFNEFVNLVKEMVSSKLQVRPNAKKVENELARLCESIQNSSNNRSVSRSILAPTLAETFTNSISDSSNQKSKTKTQIYSRIKEENGSSKHGATTQRLGQSIVNQNLANQSRVDSSQRAENQSSRLHQSNKQASIRNPAVHQSRNDRSQINLDKTQNGIDIERSKRTLNQNRSQHHPTQLNAQELQRSASKAGVHQSQLADLQQSKLEKSNRTVNKSLNANSLHASNHQSVNRSVNKEASAMRSVHQSSKQDSILKNSLAKSNPKIIESLNNASIIRSKHQNDDEEFEEQNFDEENPEEEVEDNEKDELEEYADEEFEEYEEPGIDEEQEEERIHNSKGENLSASIASSQQRNHQKSIHNSLKQMDNGARLNQSNHLSQRLDGSHSLNNNASVIEASIKSKHGNTKLEQSISKSQQIQSSNRGKEELVGNSKRANQSISRDLHNASQLYQSRDNVSRSNHSSKSRKQEEINGSRRDRSTRHNKSYGDSFFSDLI